MTRRTLLAGSSLWPLWAQEAGRPTGLILRQKAPENLETPFSELDSFLTPVDQFYVRSHFAVPALNAGAHRIRVEGHVERPFEISVGELAALGQTTQVATLECAGNGRVYLSPPAAGVQWGLGAVSTAEWRGAPLSALLQRAGVRAGAAEVLLEGADRGELRVDPRPAGPVHFARSLPLEKANRPEVLLATHMNGQPLTAAHGAPVRVVVPGYYGMASVKWLQRVVVVDRLFTGYYQTVDYAIWDRSLGAPARRPLYDMRVKASIARPSLGERIRPGAAYRVHGAAWAGASPVAKVELSSDRGQNWREARLLDEARPFAWRRWELAWTAPSQAGRHTLMARATDAQGATQPTQHSPDLGAYAISYVLPVEVDVG